MDENVRYCLYQRDQPSQFLLASYTDVNVFDPRSPTPLAVMSMKNQMLQNHWNVPSGEHILSFTPSSRPHVSSFRYAAFSFRCNTNFNSFRQLTSLQKQAFFYGTIATAAGFFPKCLPSWNTVPNCLPLSI